MSDAETTRYEVRNPNTAPPGGWCYMQPETSRVWTGHDSLDMLVQLVAQHRTINELPEGNPRYDIMHQTGYALVQQGRADLVKIFQPVERSLSKYWSGLKGMRHIVQFEMERRPILVAPDTANDRANVCVRCPNNVINTTEKLTQQLANEMMADLVGGRGTGVDDKLGTCSICTCRTTTLVHLTGELLKASGHLDDLTKYPKECWKLSAYKA